MPQAMCALSEAEQVIVRSLRRAAAGACGAAAMCQGLCDFLGATRGAAAARALCDLVAAMRAQGRALEVAWRDAAQLTGDERYTVRLLRAAQSDRPGAHHACCCERFRGAPACRVGMASAALARLLSDAGCLPRAAPAPPIAAE
jgi:hypothetical protein